MLRYLLDPANAITAGGLILSGVALHLAISRRPELSVAVGLWAMLADQLDGVVAKRTSGRANEVARIGKSLDGFGDLIYGAVIPAAVIMVLGSGSLPATAVGVLLITIGAVRLSYFNLYGLSGGRFSGVPLSYDIQLLALVLLVRPLAPASAFLPSVLVAFVILAFLHVSSLRVPSPGRVMYSAITVFAVVSSGALALTSV